MEYYNLDMIISVGYRVHSYRGVQFRIWATKVLKEYIIKGFALNDDLLKRAGGGNYFDELLARIRVMTRKKSGSRSNLFTYTNLIVVTAEQSEAGKQNLFMINLSDRFS